MQTVLQRSADRTANGVARFSKLDLVLEQAIGMNSNEVHAVCLWCIKMIYIIISRYIPRFVEGKEYYDF